MKKLNKLNINAEKLLKNEELLTLKGGYGGEGLQCSKGTNNGPAVGGNGVIWCGDCSYHNVTSNGSDRC